MVECRFVASFYAPVITTFIVHVEIWRYEQIDSIYSVYNPHTTSLIIMSHSSALIPFYSVFYETLRMFPPVCFALETTPGDPLQSRLIIFAGWRPTEGGFRRYHAGHSEFFRRNRDNSCSTGCEPHFTCCGLALQPHGTILRYVGYPCNSPWWIDSTLLGRSYRFQARSFPRPRLASWCFPAFQRRCSCMSWSKVKIVYPMRWSVSQHWLGVSHVPDSLKPKALLFSRCWSQSSRLTNWIA